MGRLKIKKIQGSDINPSTKSTKNRPEKRFGFDMKNYEIRIFRDVKQEPAVIKASFFGDYAAYVRALFLSRNGDEVEVWRDMRCIYAMAR
jgi:hypothetical protein